MTEQEMARELREVLKICEQAKLEANGGYNVCRHDQKKNEAVAYGFAVGYTIGALKRILGVEP